MKDVSARIQTLIQQQQSLFLSTLDQNGNPAASYAPYYCDLNEIDAKQPKQAEQTEQAKKESAFYIFISELSEHTQHLIQHPNAGVLIAENAKESQNPEENQTKQVFARTRVSYQVIAEKISGPEKAKTLKAMQNQFGEIIEVLSGLADFHLFKLSPQTGRYVEGFGKAYLINKGLFNEIEHLGIPKK
jgi:putative heme iron utilization protein